MSQYAHPTTAAGTSLAAIGHHFGSKDALMSTALIEASGAELGDEIEHAISDVDPNAEPLERFAATWTRMIESFAAHRPLITASFENLAQVDHLPDVREFLVQAQQQAASELARLLRDVDNTLDEDAVRTAGSFYYTLLNGLMAQWLIDPTTPLRPRPRRRASSNREQPSPPGPTIPPLTKYGSSAAGVNLAAEARSQPRTRP